MISILGIDKGRNSGSIVGIDDKGAVLVRPSIHHAFGEMPLVNE